MRRLDLTPLMRSSVGFDDIFRLADASFDRTDQGYPPYNIEKRGEDEYRITMAVAGFSANDLDVELEDRTLTITGKAADEDTDERVYIHRGIARRAFQRSFRIAETIEVKGADFENGLLTVLLERRIPDHMKPRKINIQQADDDKQAILEGKAKSAA